MNRIHELKTVPQFFEAVLSGVKTFELRENDRGFNDGDDLILREWDGGYTGRQLRVHVPYVLYGPVYGLPSGWVIMSIAPELAAPAAPEPPRPVVLDPEAD